MGWSWCDCCGVYAPVMIYIDQFDLTMRLCPKCYGRKNTQEKEEDKNNLKNNFTKEKD